MTIRFVPREGQEDAILLINGNYACGYGPREEVPGEIRACAPEKAMFWGIYMADKDGHDMCVGDAYDEASALELLPYIAMRWLGLNAPMLGHSWPSIEGAIKPTLTAHNARATQYPVRLPDGVMGTATTSIRGQEPADAFECGTTLDHALSHAPLQ